MTLDPGLEGLRGVARELVKQGRAFYAEGKARQGFQVLIGLWVCRIATLLDWQDSRGVTGGEMPRSRTGPYSGDGNKDAPSGGREQVTPLAFL